MIRLTALAPPLLIALLSACATPDTAQPGEATALSPVVRAANRPQPAIDWPAERNRIARALGSANDVAVITRNDGALQLLVPGADAFSRDGVEPGPALRTTLDRIAAVLAAMPATEILVLGHTDGMGSELHNLQLSIRRAESVAAYLQTRGITLARLQADGRGESEPFADNGTEPGRAKNRRVEIVVRPFARP